MYIPSTSQCAAPNGLQPIPAETLAASDAVRLRLSDALNTAQEAMFALVNRIPADFAGLRLKSGLTPFIPPAPYSPAGAVERGDVEAGTVAPAAVGAPVLWDETTGGGANPNVRRPEAAWPFGVRQPCVLSPVTTATRPTYTAPAPAPAAVVARPIAPAAAVKARPTCPAELNICECVRDGYVMSTDVPQSVIVDCALSGKYTGVRPAPEAFTLAQRGIAGLGSVSDSFWGSLIAGATLLATVAYVREKGAPEWVRKLIR